MLHRQRVKGQVRGEWSIVSWDLPHAMIVRGLRALALLRCTELTGIRRTMVSSGNTVGHQTPHGVRRNSQDMAIRWRSKLDRAKQLEIRRIWEPFDVPLYREPSDW